MLLELLQIMFLILELKLLPKVIVAFLGIVPLQTLLLRSNKEPVSPINTFAGCKLNIKNPKVAPITMLPNIEISGKENLIPIIVKHVIIIAETLEQSPSIPSVKFTALVVPSITTIANGI